MKQRILSLPLNDLIRRSGLKGTMLIGIIVLCFSSSITFGQSKAGTTVFQFLKIEPSARISAMGSAGASLFGDVSCAYFNPASLGRLERNDVQFSYNNWLADISYNHAIIGIPVSGIGTFSLQLTSLNSGEIAVRTVDFPLGVGEKYTVTDFAVGLGYSTMLTDRVSVGFQFDYIQETIWHSSMSTAALNFGVQYEVEKNGLAIGASVSNFGPRAGFSGSDLYLSYDFDPKKYGDNNKLPTEIRTDAFLLPTLFRVGLSYPYTFDDKNKVLLSLDAQHPNDNIEKLNAGIEYQFFDYFSLRAGYRDLFVKDAEGGLVLGGGVVYQLVDELAIRVDYGWADYGRLAQAHRFTLGLTF